MTKSKSDCPKTCEIHTFRIVHKSSKSLNSSKSRYNTSLKFCSQSLPGLQKSPFLPLFALPSTNPSPFLKQFHLLKHQLETQPDEWDIRQPRPRTTFCQVCCCKFSDYREHVDSQGHRLRIKSHALDSVLGEMQGKVGRLSERRFCGSRISVAMIIGAISKENTRALLQKERGVDCLASVVQQTMQIKSQMKQYVKFLSNVRKTKTDLPI